MPPKIVFLVMSAVSKPGTVDQLAQALAPHLVLVHHDFSQTPHFPLTAPNVRFVPDPCRTGWAMFGFVEGIFHSLRYATENLDFDYLQLLSPTCLPIKSIQAFEKHVSGSAEAHFDCVDLMRDRDALMWVGYRALTPERSFRHRVARFLAVQYFGDSPGRRDEAGIWLRSGAGRGIMPWIALGCITALSKPWIGRHIFTPSFRPYCGTTWFGARRHVVGAMVEMFSRPAIHDYFSRLNISDEFLIPSLLMQQGLSKGPMNHCIQTYIDAHVGEFQEEHLDRLSKSPAYFARKFPDNPFAPVRARVLHELAATQVFTPAAQESYPALPARPAAEGTATHGAAAGPATAGAPLWVPPGRTAT